MRLARASATLACVALIAVPLACGGDDDAGGGATQPAATTEPEPTATTPTETTDPTAAEGAGATEPGTTLEVGDTASVKWDELGRANTYDVDVTVLKAKKAKRADFKGIDLDPDQKRATPYFITARIANTGKAIPRGDNGEPGLGLEATDDKGQELENVIFLGDFPPCEYEDPPKRFKKGAEYETCLVFLMPDGGTLGEVRWTGSEPYVLDPVVWK